MTIAFLCSFLLIFRFNEINYYKVYYRRRYGSLYEELKTSKRMYLMYHPFFFLNRTMMALSIILITENFFLQIWLMIVFQFFVILSFNLKSRL